MAQIYILLILSDVTTLSQYITKYTQAALAPGKVEYYDPFWVAVAHGSTDALHMLLEQYTANIAQTEPLDKRGFMVLDVAYRYVQLATARFLLDSQPLLGIVDARNRRGEAAILATAASLACLSCESCDYDYFSERIACGEELMHLLLDRGASARDAIIPRRGGGDGQPLHTVLGWAVCRSSYGLVKRLLDEGTDVHRRKQYMNGYIQALLDHLDNIVDRVARDSTGRLPPQWVAAGPTLGSVDGESIDTSLLDFLIAQGANTTTTDKDGNTTLHTMPRNLRQVKAAQFLLNGEADISATSCDGNTPIHEAMRGTLRPRETRERKKGNVMMADRIRVQDEMF
ncbi:ankyrin [Aspergillus ruber CBS 135680]|uniref:Ankyrin n=1 Tax=Aspergillus ruber (strain CBS 135680) TaxID=1388766 RepID=A0A017S1M1_ASPRC|nr:ankyrin [Aspergillus ruber CBS 135680]EYE90852.1 ankyrin [Aspergillus ruber CBS 135680]